MISTSWSDVDFRRKPSSHFTTAMSSTGSLLVSTSRPALLSLKDLKMSAFVMALSFQCQIECHTPVPVPSASAIKCHFPGSVPPVTPPAQSAAGCHSSAGYAGPVASAAAPSAVDLAQHPPDPAPSAEPSATDHPLSAVPPAPDQPSHARYPVPVAAPAC